MIYDLGPRALRVYEALRERIQSGEILAGMQLPSHLALASEFNVAPVTVRQVLARLEAEGLVSREQGRGTFVLTRRTPAVLVVDDEAPVRAVLNEYVARAGYRPISVDNPADGLKELAANQGIALVLSDVRMPDAAAGVGFIRGVRRRWPELPIAAVTAFPDDLSDLHGTADCPVLIIAKPFRLAQVMEVFRLVFHPPQFGRAPESAKASAPSAPGPSVRSS